jgi:sec-independent protein translocase protein TatB
VFDLDISKLALIGAVALVAIGPEKLPRVARTVGTLLGKAQRYVSDVKAEVNRAMELDELQKMKSSVESAARDVQHSMHEGFDEVGQALSGVQTKPEDAPDLSTTNYPVYRHPRKNWRLKQGALPQWYKARSGVRTKALSGAARVARYRPRKIDGGY